MEERISSPNITKLHTFYTTFSADSIEWCPHEPNRNKFVCANYKLIEASQSEDGKPKRIGKIYLFSLEPNELITDQILDTSAILDQKWCHNPIQNCSILGTVDANNELKIYKLNFDKPLLEKVTSFKNGNEEKMMLSLDFSTGKYPSDEPNIVVSDTKGKIHIFKLTQNELSLETSLNGHDFEAWICAFYYWNTSIIFSGGDDSKLLKFDLRVGNDPIFKSRAHSAGVTCIHSNKEREHLIATGSYDQNLLLWDLRSMKTPLNAIEMPGPMWRLKWDPQSHSYLLTACMLGGFHIVRTEIPEPKIIGSYYEHSDLAYGSDWCHLNGNETKKYCDNERLFAACSFYDCKIYDQNLLLWDLRSMKTPLNAIEMPGPMWRLKWDPQSHSYLLTACMLGGFHIVRTEIPEPKIIGSYYEHSDLAYGSDWCHLNDNEKKKYCDNKRIFASCSFYDCKMSVAGINLNEK